MVDSGRNQNIIEDWGMVSKLVGAKIAVFNVIPAIWIYFIL